MDKKSWVLLNNGISAARIKKKKLRYKNTRGVFDLTEAISKLNDDEYIRIPIKQEIFPLDKNGYLMTGLRFKKRGNQFNMKIRTGQEMIDNKVGPQKLIIETDKRELSNLGKEDYGKICRRGNKWDTRTGKLHTIMPDRDLLRGWLLASNIIRYKIYPWYSNPGGIFFIEIPSTTNDPKKVTYTVKIYNFAAKLPGGYADWPNIEGQIGGGTVDEEAKKLKQGADIYSNASRRYNIEETRMNFQLVAAAILRQHFNDKRKAQGKFKNFKALPHHKIEPVLLNITIPPAREYIGFNTRLENNVVIEHYLRGKAGYRAKDKTGIKKLNAGEREIFYSVFKFMNGVKNCYRHDEALESLDEIVADFTAKPYTRLRP